MLKVITLKVDTSDFEDSEGHEFFCISKDGGVVYRDEGEEWLKIEDADVKVETKKVPA